MTVQVTVHAPHGFLLHLSMMAALPETPFTLLLGADSEHPLPDSDPDVTAALNAYGASFNKLKKNAAARLDLLVCLMWVHAH
jgi:hypothetical protein